MIFNKWNNAPFYSKPFLNLKNCLKISSNASVSIQSFYLGLHISKHLLTIIHRKLFSGLMSAFIVASTDNTKEKWFALFHTLINQTQLIQHSKVSDGLNKSKISEIIHKFIWYSICNVRAKHTNKRYPLTRKRVLRNWQYFSAFLIPEKHPQKWILCSLCFSCPFRKSMAATQPYILATITP